jgi:DNA polymerase III epsilon subunit-like protein
MPARFIGVDGEMTGTDGPAVHQLIQIGVATAPDEVFVSDIGYDAWSEDAESMVVHGLSAERIRAAPRADVVDAELCRWLGDKVVGSGRGLIAVGWNVAAFDLPYVRRFLPRFTSHLSRRSVDLNAVCFTFAGTAGSRWKSLKKRSKRFAEEQLGRAEWHDAGYDAAAALLCWEFFKNLSRGEGGS